MPKYTLGLPDGRTIQLEAAKPEMAQQRASEWAKANPKPQKSLNTAPKVPFYVKDESGQEANLNAPEYADERARLDREQAAQKQAEAKALSNRGMLERALDTASFAASIIPRTISKGAYGAGDVIGLASPKAGERISASEGDFARANEGFLQTAADIGEASLGVPALGQMGAPLRGMGAAVNAARASPRGTVAAGIRGAGEALEGASRQAGAVASDASALKLPVAAGRLGQGMQRYADDIQPPAPKAVQPAQAGANLPQNIQALPERLADIQAFRDEGLKPFAPATGSAGVARGARTIEELPLIGGTVKSPKTDVELGFKDAQRRVASELGDKGNEEATGDIVQRGLERYRTKGLTDIEPATLARQGIAPYQPVKPSQTMSGGAASRAADAEIATARAAGGGGVAQTARGATSPSARPLNQIGLRRTNAEDLSEAELTRLTRAPSNETSFPVRAEALYESAHRKMPPITRADGSRNPNMLGTPNTRQALLQTRSEVGNQLGAGQSTVLGSLADDLINSKTNFSFDRLKAIRTEVGRAMSNFGDYEARLDKSQLKRIYGAIARDMENGLIDISNRAWQRTTLAKTDKNYLEPAAARRADAALYEFRRADRYFRQGTARMEKFMDVLGAKTPNEAARKVTRALAENTANPQMLRQVMGSLRPDELNALRGHVIASLGAGRPGGKAAETIMSWHNWGTDYHKIMDNPAGREFMTKGLPESVSKRLDNLARIANRMKYYEQTKNFSGSAYTGIIGAGAVAFTNPMAIPQLALATLGIAGMGKLLTSSAYLAWQEGLMKAQMKAGNTAASNARIIAQHVRRLPALAKAQKADPELAKSMQALSLAIDEQLGAQEKKKARALLPPPSRN